MSRPACTDPAYDPDWWYPEFSRNPNKVEYKAMMLRSAQALEVCQRCPIIAECTELTFSDINLINYGISAGLLPHEKREAIGFTTSNSLGVVTLRRIRSFANSKNIIKPEVAKRERPKKLETYDPELG